jgi:hypothetical protein
MEPLFQTESLQRRRIRMACWAVELHDRIGGNIVGHKRAAWAILVSIATATAGGFGVIAEAATQTQDQSQALYTSQNQDVKTGGGATVTQNASDTMSTSQTETTSTDANSSVPKDSNHTIVDSKQNQDMTGDGNFSETQDNKAVTGQNRSSDSPSVQLHNQTQTSATQSGMIQTTDEAEIKQGQATLIENQQSQTVQYQGQTTSSTATIDWSYLLPAKSSTVVVGYAMFDLNGNRLSDFYGNYTSADSNWTRQYDAFTSYQPKTVVVKAVNAYGVPVNNASPITLYVHSNNVNSMFLLPHSTQIVHTVQLPAGTGGAEVVYMNTTALSQFDVLDASTYDPYAHYVSAPPQHAPRLVVDQTQQGAVSGTTTTQDQKGILTSTQSHQNNDTQSQSMSANTDANESQSVTTNSGDAVNQTQQLSVNGSQDNSNSNATANAWDATAAQNTTSSATNSVQLSQHQEVAVDDYWQNIKVTVSQTHNTDSGTLSLQQSIEVSVPTSGPQTGARTISVAVGNQQYEYAVGTGAPVVFDESQAVDTSKDNSVTQTFDIQYGTTVYHVPMSQ